MLRKWKQIIKIQVLGRQDREINKAIEKYKECSMGKQDRKKVLTEIRKCMVNYDIEAEEYFLFQFDQLNSVGRKRYLGAEERHRLMVSKGTGVGKNVFRDKYKTYETFREYYHREMIKVENNNIDERQKVKEFIERHNRIIIKPLGGYQGQGVKVLDAEKEEDIIDSYIMKNLPCVIEQLIQQGEELGKFHPSSVNSIRMVTCLTKEGTEILFAIFRMGSQGSVIDNVGAGGIVAAVDIQTGVISSLGYQKNGKKCIRHPDSGVIIPGSVIPCWDDLLYLAKSLSKIVPEQKIIGWDFAFDGEEWCVIEANHSASCQSIQMIQGGIREKFLDIIERI